MSESIETEKARINLRLQKRTKTLIERAARFQGKTVSNFILSSAVTEAERTVSEHENMVLNSEGAEAFFKALGKKVVFKDALKKALEEHEKRVVSK